MNTTIAIQRLKHYVALVVMMMMLMLAAGPVASAHRTGYRHRHRSFWSKHRDKLTVAGTTLGGAAIGGLAGGKKGALIGGGVGAGSGALYTYKLRRRHRRY